MPIANGVVIPQASMIREVGLCEEVVPMSEPSKVQKLVQHLENQSNMQVCPFKPEIQQASISKDIVPFSYVEVVGNSKNRVYKDTRNSNMEKRITRAVSLAQKEQSDLLKDKRLLPPSL